MAAACAVAFNGPVAHRHASGAGRAARGAAARVTHAARDWAWPTLAGRCIIRVLPGSVRRTPPSILTCTLGENGALPVPSPCYYFTASEHTRGVQRVKVAVTTSHAVLGTHPSNMELQP